MAIDLSAVGEAIEGTRASLDAAGFGLECESRGEALRLTVLAREDACKECLVPKPIFLSILQDELREKGLAVAEVEVVYPLDSEDQFG